MKRRLAAICVLTVALGGCHRAHREEGGQEPRPGVATITDTQVRELGIETVPVDERPTEDTILTSGRVTFTGQSVSHVFSPVSGRVTRIEAELGKRVEKGAVLAVIESPDVGAASADVGKAQAELIAAEHEFQRQKDLFGKHATSERDLEQAEDNYGKAKAELERARQKVKLLRAPGYDAVTGTYAVRAEIPGEVVARNVSPGQEVQGLYGGGTPLEIFTVAELDPVWVVADVFEMDSARVKVGARAVVKVVAYPDRAFEGKVDWVSGVLDPQTRTSKARCVFANSDRALKPEMYATVQIAVEEKRALAVPRTAVIRLGDQTVVFVKAGAHDGRVEFERRPVEVDEAEGSAYIAVLHGLNRGEVVVSKGAVGLTGLVRR